MSGFIGIISPSLQVRDSELLDRCQEEIAACCSDFSGAWKSSCADLRFGWLNTTNDTEAEHLPFTIDQNLRIVGDVRLDNRHALLENLQTQFKDISSTTPDAYLLLYAYQHWGEACLEKISGDYAFAIWNENDRSLFCARDHFGVIPFYYATLDNGFLFSNYYRSLQHIPGLMQDMNDQVLRNYLFLGINGSLDQTIYQDIKKLPASHKLLYKQGKLEISQYWHIDTPVTPIRYKTNTAYVEHFYKLFEKSVADRTRTSHVACQLSGGMDSSAIAATAKKILARDYGHNHRVVAYNISYNYLVKEREGYFAGLIAKQLDIPLRYIMAEEYLDKAGLAQERWFPEPVTPEQASPEAAISKDALSFSRVLLVGFGGDPLFEHDTNFWKRLLKQGYWLQPFRDMVGFYRAHRRLPPLYLLGKIKKLMKRSPDTVASLPDWFNSQYFTREYLQSQLPSKGVSFRSSYGILNNLMWPSLFELSHPGFSGVPIKTRQPFFSLELLRYLQAVPPHLLHKKSLLRMAMMPYLPKEVISRQKTSLYGSPHLQNSKTSGILKALEKELMKSDDFLRDKIHNQALLDKIRNSQDLSWNEYRNLLNLVQMLTWKNNGLDCNE